MANTEKFSHSGSKLFERNNVSIQIDSANNANPKPGSTSHQNKTDNSELSLLSVEREFARYERKIANYLGYFAITLTRFQRDSFGKYSLQNTTITAELLFWGCYLNTFIKSIFLGFLVTGYFGPVVFLDKIAALDYILCVGIAVCGTLIWGFRYPLHEIMHSFWTIENSIFHKLGCPQDLKLAVERIHSNTVWLHLAIVWIGCSCLAIQFYADPKYCAYTYSAFELDVPFLKIIFCLHEFIFMLNPWDVNTSSAALCTFEGVSLAALIQRMKEAANEQYKKLHNHHSSGGPTGRPDYTIDELIFDYRQLMLITDRFNEWVAYKVLAVHICSYCQFISDVFVAIQVLKGGGEFMDVWFYLEDCLAGILMIYRVYSYMSKVAAESQELLRVFGENLKYCSGSEKRKYLRTLKNLKVISMRLGPIDVNPMTVLNAMNTFGNYYVCVALW